MMDLHFYPMDVQNCTVEIESCKIVAFAARNFAKTYLRMQLLLIIIFCMYRARQRLGLFLTVALFFTPVVNERRHFTVNILKNTMIYIFSFSVASSNIWNFLPPTLRSCNCPAICRLHLKLITSSKPFRGFVPLSTSVLGLQIQHLLTLRAFINFTHVLTLLV